MGILITLFWIWITLVIVAWTCLGLFWLCMKIGDLERYLNRKLNKAFGLQ